MYIHSGGIIMIAKVFKSGNSQAVRLPKEFRFNVSEVEIFKRGDEVVLKSKASNLSRAYELMSDLNNDNDFFSNGRHDDIPQDRESF